MATATAVTPPRRIERLMDLRVGKASAFAAEVATSSLKNGPLGQHVV
jgi:hypothetical protein